MNRRRFLKAASAAPIVVALPAITVAKVDEKKVEKATESKHDQGWPKLMVGDVVAKSQLHSGFLLVNDAQTIHGMVVAADNYTYTVAFIESPDTKRLFRYRR